MRAHLGRWAALALLLAVAPAAAQQPPDSTGEAAFRITRWARPDYPPEARESGTTGDVEVQVAVSPDGALVSASAVSGPDTLRAAATRAARVFRFERRDGAPAPSGPVTFRATFSFTEEYGGYYTTLALSPGTPPRGRPVDLEEAEREDQPAKSEHEQAAAPLPSLGPGAGGGMGVGPGSGTGVGTGRAAGPYPPATEATPKAAPKPIATKVKILYSPRPAFTELARANVTVGVVRLRVLFGADGTVKEVRVVKGLPDGLNASAVAVAKGMKFEPARDVDGNAVDSWQAVNATFDIR
jgi:TonB family protein